MTRKERNAKACRAWKNRKIAEGICAHCFKRDAGGEGGTWRLCPICAESNRARSGDIVGRKQRQWEREFGPLPPHRVTVADLKIVEAAERLGRMRRGTLSALLP